MSKLRNHDRADLADVQQSLAGERRHDGSNVFGELMERLNNRLTLDNLRLSERYVEGELHVLVHFVLGDGGEYVAAFQREVDGLSLESDGCFGGSEKRWGH